MGHLLLEYGSSVIQVICFDQKKLPIFNNAIRNAFLIRRQQTFRELRGELCQLDHGPWPIKKFLHTTI